MFFLDGKNSGSENFTRQSHCNNLHSVSLYKYTKSTCNQNCKTCITHYICSLKGCITKAIPPLKRAFEIVQHLCES